MFPKTNFFIVTGLSLILLSGCQTFQDSAKEVRSKFDQTVNQVGEFKNGVEGQINEVKNKVDQVKTSIDQTKATIDQKIDQINQAGEKITEAQKAFNEANEAVKKVSQ
jgi:uncharacterized coiled-coil DUF342 family protein